MRLIFPSKGDKFILKEEAEVSLLRDHTPNKEVMKFYKISSLSQTVTAIIPKDIICTFLDFNPFRNSPQGQANFLFSCPNTHHKLSGWLTIKEVYKMDLDFVL